jgi:hypothetical protein
VPTLIAVGSNGNDRRLRRRASFLIAHAQFLDIKGREHMRAVGMPPSGRACSTF